VHYSLKHQKGQASETVEAFAEFCRKALAVGVARVLLVTGPRGPRLDTVQVLDRLARQCFAVDGLRLGVAFNACLPSPEERATERERLVRKLKTGLVKEVWLNCGADVQLLEEGITFARLTAGSLGIGAELDLFGSVLLPGLAQLQQMRERPWNGVHFGQEYLGSLQGMENCTRDVLKLYGAQGVQPIVESKVRSPEDVDKLESLLTSLGRSLQRNEETSLPPAPELDLQQSKNSEQFGQTSGYAVSCEDAAEDGKSSFYSGRSTGRRRWGAGRRWMQ
jgi:hypothetical protein